MAGERGTVLIVEARFYGDIADNLADGAIRVLDEAGVAHERIAVPGAFEVPGVISHVSAAEPDRYAGFISLGCVIRGETDHYDYVCREVAHALMNLVITRNIAHGFGILTCDTRKQAEARSQVGGRNHGTHAATACLRMMDIHKQFP